MFLDFIKKAIIKPSPKKMIQQKLINFNDKNQNKTIGRFMSCPIISGAKNQWNSERKVSATVHAVQTCSLGELPIR